MDFKRIITMITNIFIRKAVNTGNTKGIDYAARRGKSPGPMTPADHALASSARTTAKRARKAARVTRKISR